MSCVLHMFRIAGYLKSYPKCKSLQINDFAIQHAKLNVTHIQSYTNGDSKANRVTELWVVSHAKDSFRPKAEIHHRP
jgi:hypothetical protein